MYTSAATKFADEESQACHPGLKRGTLWINCISRKASNLARLLCDSPQAHRVTRYSLTCRRPNRDTRRSSGLGAKE